jgi:hypothetical protein
MVSLFQDKARKATGMQIDATGDDYGDPDLFSISVIKVSCLFLWSCYVVYLLSGITSQNLYLQFTRKKLFYMILTPPPPPQKWYT